MKPECIDDSGMTNSSKLAWSKFMT